MLANTKLIEMTYTEIQEYLAYSEREYASLMVKQEEYPNFETALRAARLEITHYYGSAKSEQEAHYAYHLFNYQGIKVGLFAFSVLQRKKPKERFVFIDYISIFPSYRRGGHARFAIGWLEEWVRAQFITKIELNVMMHNIGAVTLYHSLGYQVYRERAIGLSKKPSRYDMQKAIS